MTTESEPLCKAREALDKNIVDWYQHALDELDKKLKAGGVDYGTTFELLSDVCISSETQKLVAKKLEDDGFEVKTMMYGGDSYGDPVIRSIGVKVPRRQTK